MTSPFPIKIEKVGLRYKRGTSDKEYHLVCITCDNGQAMLIKRWNKTGIWGQMDVYKGNLTAVLGAREKIYKEKTNKGYEVTSEPAHLWANTLAELKGHLPGYVTKLSTDQLDFLVKGASAEVATPAAVKAKPAPEPPPKPTEAERYAKNPLWGAFS